MASQWRHHLFDFFIRFKHNLPKAYLNDIPNFMSIEHKVAEIQSSEVYKKYEEELDNNRQTVMKIQPLHDFVEV